MVLILSENKDISTTEIIDWLIFYNVPYLKITREDKIKIDWLADDIIFEKKGKKYPLSNFTSYWYRRGYINEELGISEIIQFNELIDIEKRKLKEYLYYKLSKLKKTNSIGRSDVNKLVVSSIAREVGLQTPDDYIVSSKTELLKLLERGQSLSTKSVSGHAVGNFNDFCSFYYTSIIEKERVNSVYSDNFFPSLVQSYIEKKYELRVFFLNESFYSMAIFSQKDSQTSVDFRNYNRVKPNRTVPFTLSKEIESKLNKLMNKLKINCGSIDIIITPNDEYVFLELNPIGQFGMVSKPCNYNIEKNITKELIVEN